MVLGVPKVPYRMPGGRHGEWVDIYQRLTRERIIFLGHDIDDETANQIIGLLLVRKKMVFVNFSMFNIFSLFLSPRTSISTSTMRIQVNQFTFTSIVAADRLLQD